MDFHQYKLRNRKQKVNQQVTLTQILIEYLYDVGRTTKDYSPEMVTAITELYKELGKTLIAKN
ncbi:hypothetical protein JZO72_08270 [Vagococcus fluvialis]|uniref:hypothetical protein n=1 Tax=Vagococcus fluvialis TaxID=2738 RepID=UPI001A90449F|nr:hypothetical protein [Vagococcus fluvialis]MBO0479624.1 hypothetical protein [Vagococcus fluvialis]MBO0485378.1 hypothetical protein [Vagococcus fluvialis]